MFVYDQLALGERNNASASGREDRYGSNVIKASRAAWKNSTIMSAAATNALCPVDRRVPSAPIRKASRRQEERQPKIGKRFQGEVFHVAHRELICRWMRG